MSKFGGYAPAANVGYPPAAVIAKWPSPSSNPPYNGYIVPAIEIPFAVVAFGMNALRFYSRRRFGALGVDDWLMMAAVPFGMIMLVVTVMAVYYGAGSHIWDAAAHPEWTPTLQKLILLMEMSAMWVHGLLRMSLLYLYIRLFNSMKEYDFWVRLGIFYNVVVVIGSFTALLLQCNPVRAYWDWDVHPRKCVNSMVMLVTINALNCVGYFYVFLLPLVPVSRSHMSSSKKSSANVLFAILFVTCAVSFTKLVFSAYVFRSEDPTWLISGLFVLCNVEKSLTMICASVPACMRLIRERRLTTTVLKKSSGNSSEEADLEEKLEIAIASEECVKGITE